MRPVSTAAETARADRHTIESLGIPGTDLMERAAGAFVAELQSQLTERARVLVLAGIGNNGGDGFAIARLLIEAGYQVETAVLLPAEKISGDAAINFKKLQEMEATVYHPQDLNSFTMEPGHFAWIVDAVFGTGLSRPVTGELGDFFQRVNQYPAKVAAVDMPSGLSGDHGRVEGAVIRADLTVTFQTLKAAHVVTPAQGWCGEVVVRDIGLCFPEDSEPLAYTIEAGDYRRRSRSPESHKGSYGAMAVIGGFAGMEGAASLSARAALRFGAGKVRIFTNGNIGRFHHDSVMVSPFDEAGDLEGYQAAVVGPGLGRNLSFSEKLLTGLDRIPVVWDADGLYLMAELGRAPGLPAVITPHPGEAGFLLKRTSSEVQADRLQALTDLGRRFPEAWVVLKGYRSLIRGPEGDIYICTTGNASLAHAGSGDVLTGMIAALLAEGYPAEDAVPLAVIRHGSAGDRWREQFTDYSMIAEDIIEDLRY